MNNKVIKIAVVEAIDERVRASGSCAVVTIGPCSWDADDPEFPAPGADMAVLEHLPHGSWVGVLAGGLLGLVVPTGAMNRLDGVVRLARRTLEALESPTGAAVQLAVGSAQAHLACDGRTALASAVAAVRHAQGLGGGRWVRAEDLVQPAGIGATELFGALNDGELVAWGQPQVDLADGHIVGAEMLVRWQHPTQGVIAPGHFLPLAQEHGLLPSIANVMLDAAVDLLARTDRAAIPTVSINIDGVTLGRADLAATVGRRLESACVAPDRLCLEITEDTLAQDVETSTAMLRRLSAMGIRLSLDDFGAGQTTLARLSDLPCDELKLDRMFGASLHRDPRRHAVVAALAGLATNLGQDVVCEGIEESAAAAAAREAGVTHGQGFFWARPMPLDDLRAWQPPTTSAPDAASTLRQSLHLTTSAANTSKPALHAEWAHFIRWEAAGPMMALRFALEELDDTSSRRGSALADARGALAELEEHAEGWWEAAEALAGELHLYPREVEMSAVLIDAVAGLSAEQDARVSVAPSLDRVRLDPVRVGGALRRLLLTLLAAASDRVTVSVANRGDDLALTIRGTMPSGQVPTVVHTPVAVLRVLVRAHGGDVLSSAEGDQIVVTALLPRLPDRGGDHG